MSAFPGPSGGGGPAPGTVIPVADPTRVTVDTTTYDNTVTGVGKLTTIVFPQDTAMLAVAVAGDAFPRWLFESDSGDGMQMGDGTFDPYNGPNGNNPIELFRSSDGRLALSGAHGHFHVASLQSANRGYVEFASNPLVTSGLVMVAGGSGAPTIGGAVGDLYIRTDGGGAPNTTIYRCTTAGTSGNSAWTGIL